MSTPDYLAAVASHLGGLRPGERQAALDDLAAVLEAGVSLDELGPAEAYAHGLLDHGPEPEDPEGSIGGMPYDTRGATDPAVRSRIWAPQDDRVIVPRLLGIGWTVNLGAVAVRLRLLRPDDWDHTTLDQVPAPVLTALRALPWLGAAAALAASAAVLAGGHDVPTGWGPQGEPRGWQRKETVLGPVVLSAAVAAWGMQASAGDDRMIRPALGAYGAGLAAAIAGLMAYSQRHPDRPAPVAAALAVPAATLVAALAVPVRIGVRNAWRAAQR